MCVRCVYMCMHIYIYNIYTGWSLIERCASHRVSFKQLSSQKPGGSLDKRLPSRQGQDDERRPKDLMAQRQACKADFLQTSQSSRVKASKKVLRNS